MRRAISIAAVMLLVASCDQTGSTRGEPSMPTENGSGIQYKEALASLIRRSDRIVVSEHSDEFDLFDQETEKSALPEQVVYATHVMSESERQFFLATVVALDPKTQDAFPACIPEVHHTIRFFSGQELEDTMDICFQCGQVIWPSTKATPPWSLYVGLSKVIKASGLSPERDWQAAASAELAKMRSNKSLERTRGK
jgi:hypothetical protein